MTAALIIADGYNIYQTKNLVNSFLKKIKNFFS